MAQRSMKATRDSYGEALAALGAENSRVVVLDADLSGPTKTALFAQRFPDRFAPAIDKIPLDSLQDEVRENVARRLNDELDG